MAWAPATILVETMENTAKAFAFPAGQIGDQTGNRLRFYLTPKNRNPPILIATRDGKDNASGYPLNVGKRPAGTYELEILMTPGPANEFGDPEDEEPEDFMPPVELGSVLIYPNPDIQNRTYIKTYRSGVV